MAKLKLRLQNESRVKNQKYAKPSQKYTLKKKDKKNNQYKIKTRRTKQTKSKANKPKKYNKSKTVTRKSKQGPNTLKI